MSTPKGDGFVIGFATVVCVVCSLLLSATASTLKSKQDYNVELDRKMNVLKAFGVDIKPGGQALASSAVEEYFKNNISEVVLDGASGQPIEGLTSSAVEAKELAERAKLPLFIWKENGEVQKYAFPISGKGLWSTIYGYMALEKDLATIKGVTFYRHGETPGLGGECEKEWFQANFKGKQVLVDGEPKFDVIKGKVADRFPQGNNHAVDGISGATLTGNGISKFIKRDLALYEKYFSLLRGS
jgi:Na+-transporting NADH:ubiquinone oxidoreductase subunit C